MKASTALSAAALLGLGLAVGFLRGNRPSSSLPSEAQTQSDESAATTSMEPEVLYWYDPMVPDQHFDKPGKSPFMDMDLVPRYADQGGSATIKIDPGIQQNLGVRTARVVLDSVPERLRVPGTLAWNQRGEQRITARVDALVESLQVRTPFERVRRGQPLATLLAPTLASALIEYQVLSNGESAESRSLAAAAKLRLTQLGIAATDLDLRPGQAPRIVVRAPRDGVISEVLAREGDTLMAGQPLFQVNDSSSLWLELRVPQVNAATLAPGQSAAVSVDAIPGQPISAEIEAVLPDVSPVTRTQGVRLVIDNADGRLAPGQFAEAELLIDDARRCPWMPREALILSGRSARVILRDADGRFEPREVQTGREVGERIEVLSGLEGGETVVVSGQFLIDSEASLSGLLARLNGGDADGASSESGDQP